MDERTQKVKTYFDQTEIYLKEEYNIQVRADIVKDWLGGLTGKNILDIGCGDGSISRQFLDVTNHLTLLDLSPHMLDIAHKKTPSAFLPQVEFLNMDFLAYQSAAPFDVVFCIGVLAHVDSVEETMKKIASMMKPGGICIIQFTDMEQIFAHLPMLIYNLKRKFFSPNSHVLNPLTYSRIKSILDQNAFKVTKSAQYSLLLPGMDKLPNHIMYRWLKFTLHSAWLSRLGSERFLMLKKEK